MTSRQTGHAFTAFARHLSCCLLVACFGTSVRACELCAIYSANNAREGAGRGFLFTVAEQYISASTLQYEGHDASAFTFYTPAYLKSWYTHLVPGYNFSSRVGLSLNVPIVYRDFRRKQFGNLTSANDPNMGVIDEKGSLTGLGDIALIARLSLLQKVKMQYSLNVNLLAGVKFPTGDSSRIDDEVSAAATDANFASHLALGGVHQHDLALGSGSFDGVFGLSSNFRWKRWFFNNQIQYYLRTEAHNYKFGDMIIVSGGPGVYFPLGNQSTFSVQANAFYESNARDQIFDQSFSQTGMTAWYLGPLFNLTIGEHFSANAGVDFPLRIYNHGLQSVPDYRVHGGFTWRF